MPKTKADFIAKLAEAKSALADARADQERLVGVRASHEDKEAAADRELFNARWDTFIEASKGKEVPKMRALIDRLISDKDFYGRAGLFVDHFLLADAGLKLMLAEISERVATRDLFFFHVADIREKNSAVLAATVDKIDIQYAPDSRSQLLANRVTEIDEQIKHLKSAYEKRRMEVLADQAQAKIELSK